MTAKHNGKKTFKSYRPQRVNANRHNPFGLGQLRKSIQSDGIIGAITVARDGETFDGSARLETLAEAMPDVKIVEIETEGDTLIVNKRRDIPNANSPRAKRLGVAANVIAKLDYNPDGEILAALAAEDEAVMEMVKAERDSLRAITDYANESMGADAEPQINRAAELNKKWKVKRDDLWRIGEHRLLCGDSTKQDDVKRIMGEDKIEMVWTDPPYGVAVGDKNKFLNSIAPSNRIEENLENDTLDESGLIAMLCAAFDNAISSCNAGASWYVAAPPGPLHILFGQILKDRGIWRQTIQWVKNNSTFSPMGVCYHWQAEPIFFGWLPDGAHRFYGGRQQTTVWNIDRPIASPEHPTMKPVELVSRAVNNSSLAEEIIYDPFCGSGTTMVACQNLSRKCHAIEISPAYCAVILQRMIDAFPGIEIERIEK